MDVDGAVEAARPARPAAVLAQRRVGRLPGLRRGAQPEEIEAGHVQLLLRARNGHRRAVEALDHFPGLVVGVGRGGHERLGLPLLDELLDLALGELRQRLLARVGLLHAEQEPRDQREQHALDGDVLRRLLRERGPPVGVRARRDLERRAKVAGFQARDEALRGRRRGRRSLRAPFQSIGADGGRDQHTPSETHRPPVDVESVPSKLL